MVEGEDLTLVNDLAKKLAAIVEAELSQGAEAPALKAVE